MARWRIVGLERETGAARTIEVDAEDERAAVLQAGRRGMVVERAERLVAIESAAARPRDEQARAVVVHRFTFGGWGQIVTGVAFGVLLAAPLALLVIVAIGSMLGWLGREFGG